MDIVSALSQQLKLPENAARGLAGQLLALIEDVVREKVSYSVASRIHDAVPEMVKWQVAAPTLAPGSIQLNELEAPLRDTEEADLIGLLERFKLNVTDSALVSSLTLQFLSSRLDPATMTLIARAVPSIARQP
ncbi:MAG: hypothetical protein IAE78_11155 [Myxococcus sp.]|nr:hypothetical protein [Myxococcus sp.]